MKSGYTTIIQSVENRGVNPAMHQHRPQNQIAMVQSFFSVFDRIGRIRIIIVKVKSFTILLSTQHITNTLRTGIQRIWMNCQYINLETIIFKQKS